MPSTMQGESQPAGAIRGKKEIAGTALKPIHRQLALAGALAAGEQLATDMLMQQLQRFDKSAEQNNRLAVPAEILKQQAPAPAAEAP